MLLVKGQWGEKETFKLIPINKDCPYVEGFYDIESKTLVLLGREKKRGLHFVQKLNAQGMPIPLKIDGKIHPNRFVQERIEMESFTEYYIDDVKDILVIIKLMAQNNYIFNFEQYLDMPVKDVVEETLSGASDKSDYISVSIRENIEDMGLHHTTTSSPVLTGSPGVISDSSDTLASEEWKEAVKGKSKK